MESEGAKQEEGEGKVRGLGSAFPKTGNYSPGNPAQCDSEDREGMSVRTWLAGHAMASLVREEGYMGPGWAKNIASDAVKAADALLEELGLE